MIRKEINSAGTISYLNEKNEYHREDGPAIEYVSGSRFWCINDLLHRIDGPAIDRFNGTKEYWIMDKCLSYENWLAIKDFPLLW